MSGPMKKVTSFGEGSCSETVFIVALLFSDFGGMPGAQFGITLANPSGGSAHRNRSVQPCCLQPDDLLVEKPPEVMAQCFD